MNTDHYTYRVTWSVDDEEFIGLCTEFPSLSWLAGSQESALRGIRKVVKEVVQDMQQAGEAIPEALAEKSFKGNIPLRVPPEVHRNLAMKAAEEGISLNRLLNSKLTQV